MTWPLASVDVTTDVTDSMDRGGFSRIAWTLPRLLPARTYGVCSLDDQYAATDQEVNARSGRSWNPWPHILIGFLAEDIDEHLQQVGLWDRRESGETGGARCALRGAQCVGFGDVLLALTAQNTAGQAPGQAHPASHDGLLPGQTFSPASLKNSSVSKDVERGAT